MGYIYKVTNNINGKMYIGQTRRTIEQRWKQHIYDSFNNSLDTSAFHCAIRKYGIEAFKIEQVEECDNEQLNNRETYWINYFDTFHNGYNLTTGGEHPWKWESKEVLSLWNKGFGVKEISKQLNISPKMVSDRLKSENITRDEIINRGAKKGGKTKRLPIYMYDRNGNYLAGFNSKYEAAEAIGYNGRANSGAFVLSTVHGYQFKRYKTDKINSSIKSQKQEVHQYTLEGNYITSYLSLVDAAVAVMGNKNGHSSIGAVCRNERGRIQAYGYRWSYNKVDKLPPIITKKCKSVIRISLDGKEHKIYPSAAQAGRENNVSYKSILYACNGVQHTAAGYKWEYLNTNN